MSRVRATTLQLSLDLQLRTLQLSRYARRLANGVTHTQSLRLKHKVYHTALVEGTLEEAPALGNLANAPVVIAGESPEETLAVET